jgi:hypothetical protein
MRLQQSDGKAQHGPERDDFLFDPSSLLRRISPECHGWDCGCEVSSRGRLRRSAMNWSNSALSLASKRSRLKAANAATIKKYLKPGVMGDLD